MENSRPEDKHFISLVESGIGEEFGRMAIITNHMGDSFTLAALRDSVPTFIISSLEEFRASLRDVNELIAVDLRRLPHEETETLAKSLRNARVEMGIVYVLSDAQFNLFEDVQFGFVLR